MALAMTLANLAVGVLHDATGSYAPVLLFFAGVSGVGLAASLLLAAAPPRERARAPRAGLVGGMGLSAFIALLDADAAEHGAPAQEHTTELPNLEMATIKTLGAREYERYEDLHRDFVRGLGGSGPATLSRSRSAEDVRPVTAAAALARPGGFRRDFLAETRDPGSLPSGPFTPQLTPRTTPRAGPEKPGQ